MCGSWVFYACADDQRQCRRISVWPLWFFPPLFFLMCDSHQPPIHVHRLKVVWAGQSCWLAVGTATSAILANICCTTRGHSEWALIPTQPCCGGKTFFPFRECRQTGTSSVAGNLQATGLLDGPGMLSVTWPHNCATAHYVCAEGCDRQHQQRAAISGPVGWIWVLKLMKGGASGLAGADQGEFVSQPCYAKTTVELI